MFEDIQSYMHMMSRMILACVLGAAVGLERERMERPAGLRTHVLVCMGSCLFMLVSIYGFREFDGPGPRDPARLAAQVVSGIGFLCAGTILHEGVTIKGLTTAAGIWIVSAIGLAIGAGMYTMAVFSTVLMLGMLSVLKRLRKAVNFSGRSERCQVKVVAKDQPGNLERILEMIESEGVQMKAVNVSRNISDDTITLDTYLKISKQEKANFEKILAEIEELDYIMLIENTSRVF